VLNFEMPTLISVELKQSLVSEALSLELRVSERIALVMLVLSFLVVDAFRRDSIVSHDRVPVK
jgi:hypothetical protein